MEDKRSDVVYTIPCKCEKYTYTGETNRMWRTRRKEHEDKVRRTKTDIDNGDVEKAEKRMNDGDGGLAKHSVECNSGIDWDNAQIVNNEKSWTQRKYLEGIETLRQRYNGKFPLNTYNKMEQWQPTLYKLF